MSELTLGIRIKVNADGSAQVLGQTGDGITRISNASDNASRKLQDMDSAAKGLGRTLTTAAAGLLTGFSIGKVIDEIGSFESKMINVHALTMANAADMKAMTAQARELGATTAFSAQQAAEAQGVLASAGLKTNEILAVTPQVLQLASAGNLEMSRTAEIAIGTMRGLGLGLSDLGRISDVAAKTAADTFSSVGDIGDAMKNASPLAKAFGIDLEDMSAAIGTLADNQLKGSEAGNNFKAMLVALGNETKDKTELLARHGVAFADLNIQQRGLVPVMDTLRKAHLTGADAITLFGSDAAAAGLILSSNSQKLGEFTKQLDSASGSTKTQADMLNTGLTKALDAFGGVVSEAALQIGDDSGGGLLGGLTNLVQTATGVISIYEGMGDKFAESNGLTKEQYENLKTVAGELGIVAGAAGGIATLTTGIWLANVAMGAFNLTTKANPLILIATTAAVGIGAVIGKINSAKTAHEDFMRSATTAEEANLKVKQQIAKINAIVPVAGAGHGATDTMIAAAKADLAILVQQRNALEEKAAATNAATEADKKSGATTAGHITQQTASSEATKKTAAETKKHAEAIQKEIDALNDQHLKLSLSERDYELYKLAALDMSDAVKASSMAVWDSIQALEAQKQGIAAGASALDAEKDRYDKLTLSANEYLYTQLLLKGVSPGTAVETVAQAHVNDGIEERLKAHADLTAELVKYNDELDVSNAKMEDFGKVSSSVFDAALGGVHAMSGAFSNMVDTINKSAESFAKLAKEKEKIDKFQPSLMKEDYGKELDMKLKAQEIHQGKVKKLELDTIHASIVGIGQIAGAAGQMFDQRSGAARAFHAIEVTMSAASIAMSAAEGAASLGATLAKLPEAITTFFAQSGWAGFAGVAGMFALLAAVGFTASGGGGGSGTIMPPPPDTTGKGTTLGMPDQVSQSGKNIYDLLESIHASEYLELKGINAGVHAFIAGTENAVTKLFQSGQITALTPASLQASATGGSGGGGFSLFGSSSTSSEISGGGITIGKMLVSAILNGAQISASQFTTTKITTTETGGLFGSDSTSVSYYDAYKKLNSETASALTNVFKSAYQTILDVSDLVGNSAVSQKIKSSNIAAMRIQLAGLTGKESVDQVTGVISSMLDKLVSSTFTELKQYQQLGEGMFETASRVAIDVAVVRDALSKSDITLLKDNAIAVSESLTKAAGGVEKFKAQFDSYFDKFYSDSEKQIDMHKRLSAQLYTVNEQLPKTREGYRHLVEGLDLSNEANRKRYSLLIAQADAADAYYKTIEQTAKDYRSLEIDLMTLTGNAAAALAAKRRDELAAMDESLKLSARAKYAIEDSNAGIDTAMTVLKKSVDAQKAVLKEKLQNETDALKISLGLTDAAKKATEDQKTAATESLTAISNIAGKLRSAVQSANTTVTDVSLQAAHSVIASALSIGRTGASIANFAGLDSALSEVAKPSEQLYTTFLDYQRDQLITSANIRELSSIAGSQEDVAKLTLDAITESSKRAQTSYDAQVKVLTDTYDTATKALDSQVTAAQAQIDAANGTTQAVLSVHDAIAALTAALDAKVGLVGGTTSTGATVAGSVQTAIDAQAAATADAATAETAKFNASTASDALKAAQSSKSAATKAVSDAHSIIAGLQAKATGGAASNMAAKQSAAAEADYQASIWTGTASVQNAAKVADRAAANAAATYNRLNAALEKTPAYIAASATLAAAVASQAQAATALLSARSTYSGAMTIASQSAASASTANAYAAATQSTIPSFDVGINSVPYDMLANVHKEERILPAADNRELMMRLSEPRINITGLVGGGRSDNSELITEIRALRTAYEQQQEENTKLRAELEKIARSTDKTSDLLTRVTRDGNSLLMTPA